MTLTRELNLKVKKQKHDITWTTGEQSRTEPKHDFFSWSNWAEPQVSSGLFLIRSEWPHAWPGFSVKAELQSLWFCAEVDLEYPPTLGLSLPMLRLSHPFITGLSAHVYLHTGMNRFSAANCCWLFFWRLVLCFSNQSFGILRGAVCFFRYGSIIYIVCESLHSPLLTVCWISPVHLLDSRWRIRVFCCRVELRGCVCSWWGFVKYSSLALMKWDELEPDVGTRSPWVGSSPLGLFGLCLFGKEACSVRDEGHVLCFSCLADWWRNDDRLDSFGPCGLPDPTELLESCFGSTGSRSNWTRRTLHLHVLRWICLVPEMWMEASESSAARRFRTWAQDEISVFLIPLSQNRKLLFEISDGHERGFCQHPEWGAGVPEAEQLQQKTDV